jgi:uncharacterized membrane protein YhaH (DUF805 family)
MLHKKAWQEQKKRSVYRSISRGTLNMDWQTLFLSAQGRIGKKDFWIGVGALFLAGMIFAQVPLLKTLWPLASIYFAVCVYGKRLHDIGQSAWLVLIPTGIMIVAITLAAVLGGAALLGGASTGSDALTAAGGLAGLGLAGLAMLAGVAASIGWIIWLGTRESEATENQFGPPREVPLVTAF